MSSCMAAPAGEAWCPAFAEQAAICSKLWPTLPMPSTCCWGVCWPGGVCRSPCRTVWIELEEPMQLQETLSARSARGTVQFS